MYELVRDRHLRNLSYTVEYYDDDDLDYDYEVHLFWPSMRSHLDVSWDSVDVFELPSIPESQLDYQFRHAGSFLPPLSPTYSIASDFVFPDLGPGGGIGRLGLYNNVFVQGFIAASQQFTRRFDGLLHKVRQGLRAAGGRSRRAY